MGDDVAVVPKRKGNLVVKADMLVKHTDMPPGMTLRQGARKAVASCVSDFAAKGAKPDSFLISLALPRGISTDEVSDMAKGFRDASKEWNLNLIGGDTNEGKEVVMDCLMLGFADRLVRRSGAKPSEIVVTTGYFGYSAAGLRILTGGAETTKEFKEKAVRSVVLPSPSVDVGLAIASLLTSSMDSSDGLAVCLHTLAWQSGVGIRVDLLPVADDLVGFARLNGLPAQELVLYGGEEYLIVGTMKAKDYARARSRARRAGGELLRIGHTTAESGTVVLKAEEAYEPIRKSGWRHVV